MAAPCFALVAFLLLVFVASLAYAGPFHPSPIEPECPPTRPPLERSLLAQNISVVDPNPPASVGPVAPRCDSVKKHPGYPTPCAFLRAHPNCRSGSVVDYARFFFCTCWDPPHARPLGLLALSLWLLALFYMLGNTAADYFCGALESLSKLLGCSATLAGVTLLPLGNGAPDVFASIAAFVGAGAGEVGLNSVLGGAVFITTVVAGSVSLRGGSSRKLDRLSFIRDLSFFLVTLASLVVMLLSGELYLWGAALFLSIYALYALSVAASELFRKHGSKLKLLQLQPVASKDPFDMSAKEEGWVYNNNGDDGDDSLYNPLLEAGTRSNIDVHRTATTLPQWMWASNVAIYSHHVAARGGAKNGQRPLWGWGEDEELHQSSIGCLKSMFCSFWSIIEWPIALPRRLTIPSVDEDRWSRPAAIRSAFFAPPFVALVIMSRESAPPLESGIIMLGVGALIGAALALLAFLTTRADRPPRRFLFPWLAGGFLMSIVWFFVIANELVSLLVAIGAILEISPSVLALTVLAWGNSMGDLTANVALASNGGDGLQIAMSGCYAGPMFNMLIGLGISLVLGSLQAQPAPLRLPKDGTVYYTLGFLTVGLLWSLVVLLISGMRANRLHGLGLISLYVMFLAFRFLYALGIITLL